MSDENQCEARPAQFHASERPKQPLWRSTEGPGVGKGNVQGQLHGEQLPGAPQSHVSPLPFP